MKQGMRARANSAMAKMARALWSESEPRMDRDWVEWAYEWAIALSWVGVLWVVWQMCKAVGL